MFGAHAKKYLEYGLAIIPCAGKKPVLRWEPYKRRLPTTHEIDGWLIKHRDENIGAVTGEASGITVVDIDSTATADIQYAINRFGDTPLKVGTPRGGLHLYYKYNGERTATKIDGQPLDIRAHGGFIVIPPSVNPDTGKPYVFLEGDFGLLESLPCAKNIPLLQNIKSSKKWIKSTSEISDSEMIEEGQRNDFLFRHLRTKAFTCDTMEALMDIAFATNNHIFSTPLPAAEVEATVASVWRYKVSGNLKHSGQQFAAIDTEETDRLKDKPYALALLTALKQAHDGVRAEFNAVMEYYAGKMGWQKRTVSDAMKVLIERGMVEVVAAGGRFKGDKAVYRFKGA